MFTKKIEISIFLVMIFSVFAFGLSIASAATIVTEDSYVLCHDGLDNDDNGSSDMADLSCASFAVDTTLTPENSYALCHDTLDNDDNGSSDMADASCTNYATLPVDPTLVAENTYELCHDSLDNDDNGSSDMADLSCASYSNPPVTPSTPTPSTRRSSGGSRRAPVANLANSQGQVLGETVDVANSTCAIRTGFLKRGFANNVEDVKRLQTFLNTEVSAGLPITGFFGPLTEQAVNKFQIKYSEEILLPWFKLGLNPSATSPTGYVYKTTLYKINSILCPNTNLIYPVLN